MATSDDTATIAADLTKKLRKVVATHIEAVKGLSEVEMFNIAMTAYAYELMDVCKAWGLTDDQILDGLRQCLAATEAP